MAKKGSTAGQKLRYSAYKAKDNVTKNAKRKLERHLKKHPNDAQAAAATPRRTRKTPTARFGWVKDGVKDALFPATVTRSAAREVAQVFAFSLSIARKQYTKAEQKASNKFRK